MKVFVLKTCQSCKKALAWLEEQNIAFTAHDVRADGLTRDVVAPIVQSLGWEKAVNRRSTTWRNLSEADRDRLDADKATTLIVDNPTLMKRPVFVTEQEVMAGFDNTTKAWLSP